ncbi:MAG: hypothetical protein IT515_05750 [Burkholderiales bacterium]|nr:hypothetical protein [Burkholderiales bacterium]
MAQGSLYVELMSARTEKQVAALVERYLRTVADDHPRGFAVAEKSGASVLPLLSTASRVQTAADIELLHATVSGFIETARARGEIPEGLAEIAEILAAAQVRLKQLRRPAPGS